MNLSDEQQATVASWVREGLSLADIQKQIEEQFGQRMTYMDVRFLVDDLDLELKAKGPEFKDPTVDPNKAAGSQPGKVTVSLDKVARPDALVSGSVTFSDGIKAQWHLDQMGRLALNPSQKGYQPGEEDLRAFQEELRAAVEKSGMM